MIQRFKNFIRQNNLVEDNAKILLAVSGGADSVAMLDLFVKAGYNVAIAHVNFHLRGNDSNRDEQFVTSLANKYNVKIFVKSFDTNSYAAKNHISIEMAARDLRYAEFNYLMETHGFSCTAVAHHIDDAVETFMLNLLRGTGISGLTGMHEINGKIIRPMLCFTRNEIENYIKINGLQYVTDVTNFETEFSRNKIRNCIVPYFEQINPSFRNSFADTFKYMRQVKDIYFDEIERQKNNMLINDDDCIKIDINALLQYPYREAFLFEVLRNYGFNKQQVAQINTALTAESGKTFISNKYRLIKDRNYLIIKELDNVSTIDNTEIIQKEDIERGVFNSGDVKLKFELFDYYPDFQLKCDSQTAFFDYDKLTFPLTLRHWQQGDTFVPFGKNQTKKLSNLFIDNKLSVDQKSQVRILCSNNNIIWVVGIRASNLCRVSSNTRCILKIYNNLDK